MKTTILIALALSASAAAAPPSAASVFDAASTAFGEEQSGFTYAIPAEAQALPGLAGQLGNERETARQAFEEMQAEYRRDMPDSPMTDALSFHLDWSVAGQSHGLLSLVSTTYRYDGGAHGNTAYGALLWDVAGDHAVSFTRLFADRYAALSVIDRAYCTELGAMQAERGIDPNDEWWGGCPALHEMTILPAAESDGPFTTIVVLVAPYAAGPYSAGSFEIEVPVTAELVALLRPQYRAAFAPGD